MEEIRRLEVAYDELRKKRERKKYLKFKNRNRFFNRKFGFRKARKLPPKKRFWHFRYNKMRKRAKK